MQLSNAFALRDQLIDELSLATTDSAMDGAGPPQAPPYISIGAAHTADLEQFKLAVRFRKPDPELLKKKQATAADIEQAQLLYAQCRNVFENNAEYKKVKEEERDVLVTGPVRTIKAASNSKPASKVANSTLRIGASVSHILAGGGTIGFFARRLSDGALGLVSANHVIALEDQADDGNEIISPAFADHGGPPAIARLDGSYPRLDTGGPVTVDCAFAVLEPGVLTDVVSLGKRETLQPFAVEAVADLSVRKLGRSTKRTEGRIRGLGFKNVTIGTFHFDNDITFTDQIEIESTTRKTFSDPGDSGSLVYDSAGRPVGLLFAETAIDGHLNLGLQYANPIAAVLAALKVELAV